MFRRITTAAALLAASVAACDSAGPAEPRPQPPLHSGVWHLHQADGGPPPVLVAQVNVDGRVRRTFLDSATLRITMDGHWDQQLFLETWEDDGPINGFTESDGGTWIPTDTGYLLISDVHGSRRLVRNPAMDSMALTLRVEGSAAVRQATLRRTAPPPLLTAEWRATHVRGQPVPDAMYTWPVDSIGGEPVSVHWVVDSARIALHPTGRYVHRVWVTQWVGDPGGPPLHPTLRFYHGDFGEWNRSGTSLGFVSHWLQNHTMTGSFGTDGVLRMEHGFSHGDTAVDFRYGR